MYLFANLQHFSFCFFVELFRPGSRFSWHQTRGTRCGSLHVPVTAHVRQHISEQPSGIIKFSLPLPLPISGHGSATGSGSFRLWHAVAHTVDGCQSTGGRLYGPTADEHTGQHTVSTQSGGVVWRLGGTASAAAVAASAADTVARARHTSALPASQPPFAGAQQR